LCIRGELNLARAQRLDGDSVLLITGDGTRASASMQDSLGIEGDDALSIGDVARNAAMQLFDLRPQESSCNTKPLLARRLTPFSDVAILRDSSMGEQRPADPRFDVEAEDFGSEMDTDSAG
jgi:hypothetical protein